MRITPTVKIQRSVGFTGGGIRARMASLVGGPNQVQVGFPDGEDGELAQRAAFNEFGTRGSGKGFKKQAKGGKMMGGFGGPIPERPFLRNAMRANRDKYRKLMASSAWPILKAAATGKDAAGMKLEALRSLGALAQGDIQAEITALSSPPNAPLTIALKGSNNPLIDTGEMRRGVSWRIEP